MSQLQNCIGMCTKNGSYCEKAKNRGGGGQGRCELRSEAFVKIKKKTSFFGGGGWGGGQGGCERRSEAFFCENSKKKLFFLLGGGGRVWGGGGVRVDVNGEVKLL